MRRSSHNGEPIKPFESVTLNLTHEVSIIERWPRMVCHDEQE